ncbi:hypothetical protein [Desmospora activa]|uniref:Uncharacterized protein n=1 Tax=Desmospora activa DSM 45169 TaxID=1121389 RepID=A0A2T4Z8Y7_9BACL|nr:hypothetical protein [Desmospora activa]PTM58363.1 hypothetical protein C8J48_0945 [Desmospora activa DSM 45169]
MGAIHVKKDSANYFYTIGVSEEMDYHHFSLILDANAVIALRSFYYKPHAMRPDQKNGVIELLITNYKKDFIPGFGIHEASYHPSKAIQHEREKEFLESIEEMYSWSPNEILKHAKSNGIKRDKKKVNQSQRKINTYIPMLKSLPLLAASYACLLKLHLLNSKKSKFPGIQLYEEFMLFQNDDLKTMSAFETILAFDYLVNNKDYVSKLMKFGSPNLQKVSSACWDLFYLRLLHNNFYKGLDGIINPKLITSDEGLSKLATNSSLKAILDLGEDQISMIVFNTDVTDKELQKKINNIEHKLTLDMIKRYSISDEERFKRIIDTVEKLEKQLYK